MASYNKRPSRLWLLSGKVSREGIPLWYSVPRSSQKSDDERDEDSLTASAPVESVAIERVSDEESSAPRRE